MREFKGRVAVVTGAASGMGQAFAERFAAEGMKVVLADIEEPALAKVAASIEDRGSTVLAVRTDVSSYEAVENLADKAYEAFGAVHVLCNNAGVTGGQPHVWEATVHDWQWVIGVNLFGLGYGLRAFVPRMLEGGEEGHIVNTSSTFGLHAWPGADIYSASKHGVLAISEGLHYELRELGSKIHVSVLCPGMIATRILDAERNRPGHLKNDVDPATAAQQAALRAEMVQRFRQEGMPPSQVADMVVDAIRSGRYYILTHPKVKENVRKTMEDILEERVPEPVPMYY